MERADDAIGMAKPAVAHKSKTAKNKFFFFIELLEMNAQDMVLKSWFANHFRKAGLHRLDARREPHVGGTWADFSCSPLILVPKAGREDRNQSASNCHGVGTLESRSLRGVCLSPTQAIRR